jgi:hypothetical protein
MRVVTALALLMLAGPALADDADEPSNDSLYGPQPGTVYSDGSIEGGGGSLKGDTDGDGQLSDEEDAAEHPAYGPSASSMAESADGERHGSMGHGGKPQSASKSGGSGTSGSPHGSSNGGGSSGSGRQAGDGPGGK